MSNRSYIYSTSLDKSLSTEQKDEKITGVSEYAYSIPLSYKILVSQDTKMVKSIIWDHSALIALQGDYDKGRKKLYDFIDKLWRENIFDKSELMEKIARVHSFLDSPDIESTFFHLENGEIYDMNEQDLEIQNRDLYKNEIMDIDKTIRSVIARLHGLKQKNAMMSSQRTGLFAKKKKQKQEAEIRNTSSYMWELLGIDYWSDTLYYDFSK